VKAGELNKAEKVLDAVLPSGDEAAEVVHSSEEPLHSSAPTIAALASVLSLTSALSVRRDQFDVVFVSASSWSSASESYALSPTRQAGNSSRKLLALLARGCDRSRDRSVPAGNDFGAEERWHDLVAAPSSYETGH